MDSLPLLSSMGMGKPQSCVRLSPRLADTTPHSPQPTSGPHHKRAHSSHLQVRKLRVRGRKGSAQNTKSMTQFTVAEPRWVPSPCSCSLGTGFLSFPGRQTPNTCLPAGASESHPTQVQAAPYPASSCAHWHLAIMKSP